MFLDCDEMDLFRDRAGHFFAKRPDLLVKLKKYKNTFFWTASDLMEFDRMVFCGSSCGYISDAGDGRNRCKDRG